MTTDAAGGSVPHHRKDFYLVVSDSQESHKESLSLPGVKQAISKAMPMLSGFDSSTATTPVGGHGLPR